ncbi:putative nucleotidyltransferase substrate binding domain-containing protein [Gordonia sp. LSe1-13]|uniref:Nucleotidyltransferase substrate binding domain-containing protein n=1 Tax=Gordonia sesuvii TaxID=3116777 RepID=A0ABU7MCQ0_9ACTN|nr:putative nucleotidyltransferase substrate binding domain-containing protein [Gordonia sp. LSe1-13]
MTDSDREPAGRSEKLTVARRRDRAGVGRGIVGDLLVTRPLMGTATMTVREAAAQMTDRGQEHMVIPLSDRGYGVLTDADIRSGVVAAGRGPDMTVDELVRVPVPVVHRDTAAIDALTELLDHDLTAMPVVDGDGAVIGVVAAVDFIAAPSGPGMSLRAQVSRAGSVDDLQSSARRVPYLVADMLRREQPVHEITAVASLIHDAVVRRALDLVFDAHPDLDRAAVTWLSLGSNARREPVLTSDIDSAVTLDDDLTEGQIADYRTALGEVNEVLSGAGLPIDENGAIAAKPLFARTHTQWRSAAQGWLADPLENKGLIFTSLLLDARPIWGDPSRSAGGEVFGELRHHSSTMGLLLAEALSYKARLRSMRDVLTRRADTFEIKAHGLTPVVNIARWAALGVGSHALDTRSRLRAAAGSPMLSEAKAADLVEVFDVLQRVRLTYQVAQFDRGEPVGDVLDMKRLSPLDRSLVAQAVREIAGVQRTMSNMSQFLPAGETVTE